MRYSTRLFNFISPLPLDPHVACSRSRSLAPSDRSQGYNCFFFFIQRPARQTHWHLGQSPVENRAIIRPLTRASFHLLRSNTALSGPPSFVSRSRVPASVRSTAPCPLSSSPSEWAGRSDNFLLYRSIDRREDTRRAADARPGQQETRNVRSTRIRNPPRGPFTPVRTSRSPQVPRVFSDTMINIGRYLFRARSVSLSRSEE